MNALIIWNIKSRIGMNIEICKKCNRHMFFYVIDDTIKGVDKEPFFECHFQCNAEGSTFNLFFLLNRKVVEAHKMVEGKWKCVHRKKYWFKPFKSKFINNKFKEEKCLKCFEECPYYAEHEICDWNENEHRNL